MKRNFIKQARLVLALVTISAAFAACNKDVLNKSDLNGVDPGIWDTESATTLFLNATYDRVMPNWPTPGGIHNTSDELGNATASILNGTLTGTGNEIPDVATGNNVNTSNYFWIYRCNLAIDGINHGALSADVKAKLKGQFFFLRGYIYFNLVRIYGGMPLILKVQSPNIDSLYVPRSKSSDCIKQITADMDSAAAMLPATWAISTDGGRINRATAAAYKGKALLYWASPQFNPTDIRSRWDDAYAACKAAYNQAVADGFALYPSSSGGLGNLWIDETANNKERMMWRTLDATTVNPTHGTNNENITRPISETTGGGGSNQPTWNLVTAFPMANGLQPYLPDGTVNSASGYDATAYWLNRDPRFNQTIAYNGQIWNLSGKSNRHEWTYTGFLDDASKASGTGFYCRKISNPTISAAGAVYNTSTSGGSGMDWIELRFAEVLLNYAEAANGAGFLAEAQNLCIALRQARGFTAAAAGGNNYGMSVVTSRDLMSAFLLNEREVEFAMEGKRYWDLRRTRQFEKLTGKQRFGLRLAVNSPFVAGAKPTTIDPTKTYLDFAPSATTVRLIDTLNVLTDKRNYIKYFTPTIVSIEPSTAPIINYPINYYFYPLPSNFLTSSPLVQQTAGWPGGSFDPLQ
ncbi:MAG: RagB/SusD family nutrient uptake outer membrane protein [Mucilaginibacter sp.]|uniref:RagB/SusD family nutrient uptake outer membrane protein n=1 Tax=Mucilaginibacter sp. TaxID=1882438 RepID=UPI0032660026